MVELKFCQTCQVDRERYKNGDCKVCAKNRARKWSKQNPEKKREINRQSYHKNKEKYRRANLDQETLKKYRERDMEYFFNNREKRYQTHKEWRDKNRDTWAEYGSRWQKNNPEKVGEKFKRYKERLAEAGKLQDYYARGNNARRARMRDAFVEHVDLTKLIEVHGSVCHICGKPFTDTEELRMKPTIDHLVPLSKGGDHSYENTRPAHYGCNSSKKDTVEVP